MGIFNRKFKLSLKLELIMECMMIALLLEHEPEGLSSMISENHRSVSDLPEGSDECEKIKAPTYFKHS